MTPFNAEQMADGLRKILEQVENQSGEIAKKWFESDEFIRAAHWNTTSAAHLQKLFGEQMARNLAGLNMPTRDDVTALGERLMAIEERLSQIETLLFRMAPKEALAAPQGPARTRKPAARAANKPALPARAEAKEKARRKPASRTGSGKRAAAAAASRPARAARASASSDQTDAK